MAPRRRLDAELVRRGLAADDGAARLLVDAGRVLVGGAVAHTADRLVGPAEALVVQAPPPPYVSRGGHQLAAALDAFGIDVAGRLAVDIGASTGGFTDVLLQRGARRVIAVDVGHNQLHFKLRRDERVTVLEGINARTLSPADLPELGSGAGIVTIDVSFISLRLIFPAVRTILAPHSDVVALVKPQFEAGRADVGKGGLVTSPDVHARVVDEVSTAAAAAGLMRAALVESPITGAEGNREFLMHLRPTP
jgi:23S rRNA (cytidine1920-2'-O)/16S rRNA (cytidine1409-2'-O)-methyltransferase